MKIGIFLPLFIEQVIAFEYVTMDIEELYTRVYSPSSAGSLVSGLGGLEVNGPPLGHHELFQQFRLHCSLSNRKPTALVSVSSRLIDTLHRAYSKFYDDGEDSATIWIAFIRRPATSDTARCHSAKDLARLSWPNNTTEVNRKFKYEFVFEWKVPQELIVHQVSLKTLIDRGFDMHRWLWSYDEGNRALLSTGHLRELMARYIYDSNTDPYDIGRDLGHMAWCFGAPENVFRYISFRLRSDPVVGASTGCETVCRKREEHFCRPVCDQFFTGRYPYFDTNKLIMVDFMYLRVIEDGIEDEFSHQIDLIT